MRAYTLLAFAIGSAYGGFAGALYAPLVEFIDPSPFALGQSFLYLLMVVVGGAGLVRRPVHRRRRRGAAAGMAALRRRLLPARSSPSLVMLLMAFCPSGIVGLFERLVRAAPAASPKTQQRAIAREEAAP